MRTTQGLESAEAAAASDAALGRALILLALLVSTAGATVAFAAGARRSARGLRLDAPLRLRLRGRHGRGQRR